ncbi:hypothetical protein L208DRAFT_1385576 [Tricholoma matsutake]|nr:hypothetical protein L208DRAFT_1385576 [Tricholoma matsutake 945]
MTNISSSSYSSTLSFGGSFIRMTVDDLSYTPSSEEVTRHADQRIVTGRRSWRMLKGKTEAVWPPNLEAALLEALERYKPLRSGPYGTSGRFPLRNQFISDFIHETTGKRRTPKQVGSRLQQLRDTSKKGKLVDLISRRKVPDRGFELPPPRSTQAPDIRPSVQQGDPVNNPACQSQAYVYGTDLHHLQALPYSLSGTIHSPEILTNEMSAIRTVYPPFTSGEREQNEHEQQYDHLLEDRVLNIIPWQMMPSVFPYF